MKKDIIYLALNPLGCLSLILLCSTFVIAQEDTIRLKNPSFEGAPFRGGQKKFNLKGWSDCGNIRLFFNESPPDLHPEGLWGVSKAAHEGSTYLGMVFRDNHSYESVGTQLGTPLKSGQIYLFSVFMAKSEEYKSMSRKTKELVYFSTPGVLKIWGATELCKEEELLYESEPVNNIEWVKFDVKINPSKDYTYLIFSANFTKYKKGMEYPYNGNILIDNISDIIRVK